MFPYKHIMWDWNGTLVNDSWLSVKIINQVLSKRQMPCIDHERYLKLFGFPVSDYYLRLGFDFGLESFEKIGTEFIEGYEANKYTVGLHENAVEVIQTLKAGGVSHSILSAYKQETLDELVKHFQIDDLFMKIVGLDNHFAESKVENGIQWMAELGMEASDILFVGDTEHDHEVAMAIGVDCVLIEGGHQARETIAKTGAKILTKINDILLLTGTTAGGGVQGAKVADV
ncbi:MAG: HAD family hydrolase [Candidatus Marinimicrobia bacterium]|nr:HAD family hydrolase [Candidatus Neomarinimicrobiota bacterium]